MDFSFQDNQAERAHWESLLGLDCEILWRTTSVWRGEWDCKCVFNSHPSQCRTLLISAWGQFSWCVLFTL